MFTKIPFKVNYPLNIFGDKEINFMSNLERELLFKRNIYYNFFKGERNNILEENNQIYYSIGKAVIDYINKCYQKNKILNLSLFGSSTFLKNPGDYDFLAIVDGNVFALDEPLLIIDKKEVQTGISIKGVENYINGFKKKDKSMDSCRLEQIIDRTAISLFRRHIPLFGKDFVNNEEEFLKNAFAQVSDLINNTYDLFYLDQKNHMLSEDKRSKKILTRCYEATSYFMAIDKDERIEEIRKEIYLKLINGCNLKMSKLIFEKFGRLYEERLLLKK